MIIMMMYIALGIFFLSGVLLFIKAYRQIDSIIINEKSKTFDRVLNSLYFGFSFTLIFFSIVNLWSIMETKIVTISLENLLESFGLFLIPGFFVFLGSLWKNTISRVISRKIIDEIKKK
jgi:hypothetical protein